MKKGRLNHGNAQRGREKAQEARQANACGGCANLVLTVARLLAEGRSLRQSSDRLKQPSSFVQFNCPECLHAYVK